MSAGNWAWVAVMCPLAFAVAFGVTYWIMAAL